MGAMKALPRWRGESECLVLPSLDCSLDIFFVEALINGVLLAGLLALLALGLNLIFGVIDVVWICYAELVMIGMYVIFYVNKTFGLPFPLACLFAILFIAAAGAVLHYIIIRPVLDQPPINQLLVTGGVLFVLQAVATMVFGVEFRSLGLQLGSLQHRRHELLLEPHLDLHRRAARHAGAVAVPDPHLYRHGDPCHLARPPGHAVDGRRQQAHLSRDVCHRWRPGGPRGLLMVLQYDIYPQIGLQFGPLTFMICVLGGLGNMVGGFVAAFIIAQFIAVGGSCLATEWGYAVAFLFFMVAIFIKPQGLFGAKS